MAAVSFQAPRGTFDVLLQAGRQHYQRGKEAPAKFALRPGIHARHVAY